jgi:hypothetical protein
MSEEAEQHMKALRPVLSLALALAEAGAEIAGLGVGDVAQTGEDITALGRLFLPV